jgi:hypothetical protein
MTISAAAEGINRVADTASVSAEKAGKSLIGYLKTLLMVFSISKF